MAITNIEKATELKFNGDFLMRSCWECNPTHKHLKQVGGLFVCFDCGRDYMNGNYFTNREHCDAEFIQGQSLRTNVIKLKRL